MAGLRILFNAKHERFKCFKRNIARDLEFRLGISTFVSNDLFFAKKTANYRALENTQKQNSKHKKVPV